jgi:hypothetical protein
LIQVSGSCMPKNKHFGIRQTNDSVHPVFVSTVNYEASSADKACPAGVAAHVGSAAALSKDLM